MSQIFIAKFSKLQKEIKKNTYSPQPYKASWPFSMIHSEIWGPSRVTNLTKTKWFVSFIDDHTRICWVYLLKEKSETTQVFKEFHSMIQTQFQTQIQILWKDNGIEYFNSVLDPYLKNHGIIQQSLCAGTPQQNGIAEQKNPHLLEVARSLMFTTHMPKHFWGEAILNSAFLINQMPSRILVMQTPLDTLLKSYPTSRLHQNLHLRVFGCTCFVHYNAPRHSKLEPCAIKCVFLG